MRKRRKRRDNEEREDRERKERTGRKMRKHLFRQCLDQVLILNERYLTKKTRRNPSGSRRRNAERAGSERKES